MTVEQIRKEHATRVINELELALSRRTHECLVATCIKRHIFQMKHNRPPTPDECSLECPYHPDFANRFYKSSPGRTSEPKRGSTRHTLVHEFAFGKRAVSSFHPIQEDQ